MTLRQYIVTMTVLTALLLPVTAYPHGHSQTGESRTIVEAYGAACFTALHRHYPHPVISRMRISHHGATLEITFPYPHDLPQSVMVAALIWDFAEMSLWQGAYNDARQWRDVGHIVGVRATQLANDFLSHYQGVCKH